MKSLLKDDSADVSLILTAVVMGIVFAVSIAIIYSILGGIDYTSIDANLGGVNTTEAANASTLKTTSVTLLRKWFRFLRKKRT